VYKKIKVYHQVNLIIPFRDIMVVEKQTDNSNLPDIEIQSPLLIITKERVNFIFYIENKKTDFRFLILGWNIYFFEF